jgi:hypothetical protein
MSGKTSSISTSSASLAMSKNLEVDEKKEYTADEVLKNLFFVGFDPAKLRSDIKKVPDFKLSDIKVLTAAYVQIGNNPMAATNDRRVRPMRNIDKLVKKYNTTLARIAIAHMPLVLGYRKRALELGVLQNQFPDSKIDPVYQDVTFSGWLSDEIEGFLVLFDKALSKTGNSDNHGPESVKRWIRVAQKGFNQDQIVKSQMSKTLSFNDSENWLETIYKQ